MSDRKFHDHDIVTPLVPVGDHMAGDSVVAVPGKPGVVLSRRDNAERTVGGEESEYAYMVHWGKDIVAVPADKLEYHDLHELDDGDTVYRGNHEVIWRGVDGDGEAIVEKQGELTSVPLQAVRQTKPETIGSFAQEAYVPKPMKADAFPSRWVHVNLPDRNLSLRTQTLEYLHQKEHVLVMGVVRREMEAIEDRTFEFPTPERAEEVYVEIARQLN